ncbi:MAG: L,D-transpeptidase family protein [Pseudomonas sp.]
MRWFFVVICGLFIGLSHASTAVIPAPAGQDSTVHKVLVVKSERRLSLISFGKTLKSYRISLGKQPEGAKRYEGDQRTPEGFYWLDWRKSSDKYNLSMHVSYPNARDLTRANKHGLRAGSMIMLHGTPLDEEYPEWFFHSLDWTEGCIALKNTDMQEIWSLVKDGTLIEIRP